MGTRSTFAAARWAAPLALLALATGGRSVLASDGDATFVQLLRATAGDVSAAQLALVPGAVAGYLAVAAAGTLPDEFGSESPLNDEQQRLMGQTAALLPLAEIAKYLPEALRADPDPAWRRAALELLGPHATASELKLMIRLVPELGESRAQVPILTAFREALIELVQRDPTIFEELGRTGFVQAGVAVEIVRAVGMARDARGASWLTEQLDDTELVDVALQELERMAAELGPVNAVRTARAVRPFLWSDEASRRGHAMRALAAMGDAAAVPRLIEMLELSTGGERRRTLAALRDLSGCELPDAAAAWQSWHRKEQRWWDEQGPATLEQLSSAADGEVVAAIRDASKRTLQRDQLAIRMAVLLRKHESPTVRRQVCLGLARLGSRAVLGSLVLALDDEAADVRAEALRALKSISGLSLPLDQLAWYEALRRRR